jgi:hypothetical protein
MWPLFFFRRATQPRSRAIWYHGPIFTGGGKYASFKEESLDEESLV